MTICRICKTDASQLLTEQGTAVPLMKFKVGPYTIILCKVCLAIIIAAGARGAERYLKKIFEDIELQEVI